MKRRPKRKIKRSNKSLKNKSRYFLDTIGYYLAKYQFVVITVVVILVVVTVGIVFSASSNTAAVKLDPVTGEAIDVATDNKKSGLLGIFTPKNEKENNQNTTVESEVVENPVVLAYNENTKNGYMNNCVFLGDSRTVAAVNYRFIQDDAAFAQVGISHFSVSKATIVNNAGKEYTLSTYLAAHQSPVVYVCYGVNGMAGASEEKYETSYEELVDEIIALAPNSRIVLMSIWPVDDNGPYKKSCQNSWIEKYNDFLLGLAEKKGINYLNINEILADSNGQMKPEYNAGDGLHYAASAYNDIIDYIIHHPVPGVKDDGEYKVNYVKPNKDYTNIVKKVVENPSVAPELDVQTLLNLQKEQEMKALEEKKLLEEQEKLRKKEEEERLKKEQEEKLKKEQEEKLKKEQEERRRLEEEAAKRKAEEEAKKKEQENNQHQTPTPAPTPTPTPDPAPSSSSSSSATTPDSGNSQEQGQPGDSEEGNHEETEEEKLLRLEQEAAQKAEQGSQGSGDENIAPQSEE